MSSSLLRRVPAVDRTWPWDTADASEAPEDGGCRQAFVRVLVLIPMLPRRQDHARRWWRHRPGFPAAVNIGSTPKSPEYMAVKRAGPAGRPHLEGSGHPARSGVGSSEPQGASMTPSTHSSKLYTLPRVHRPAWSSAALGNDVDSPALCDPRAELQAACLCGWMFGPTGPGYLPLVPRGALGSLSRMPSGPVHLSQASCFLCSCPQGTKWER